MHVLHNVHEALAADGLLLDAHPLGTDYAVRAGERGLGFIDTRKFGRVVEAMDAVVDRTISEGLFEEIRTLRRHVVERFDNASEALEEADNWENLRLPPAVRRRLRATNDGPVEFVDPIFYRLLKKA